MIDLRTLSYFVAVHEEGSITAAAVRCRVAQPSITNALQTLEGRLGCRLFERTRRGSVATPEGDRFYRRAVGLLAHARAVEHEFGEAGEVVVVKLFVQADILLAAVLPILDLLYRQRPSVRGVFCTGAGEADIAIVANKETRQSRSFNPLWKEDYVLATPGTDPRRFLREANLQSLHGIDLIDRPHCIRHDWFKDRLATSGAVPTIVARAASEETVLALLRMGVGAAVLPERHVPVDAPDITIVRFARELRVTRHVGLMFNSKTAAKKLGLSAEAIQEVVAKPPAVRQP